MDNNNILCFLNPVKKGSKLQIDNKIPYQHEKEIRINEYHSNYNHAGSGATYINILKNLWFLQGIIEDIKNFIKSCPNYINLKN